MRQKARNKIGQAKHIHALSPLRGRENTCTVKWGSSCSQLQPHLELKILQLTFSLHKFVRHVDEDI